MNIFEREIKVSVENEGEHFKISGSLNDTSHYIKLSVLVEPGTMRIKAVTVQMDKVPYAICHKAFAGIDSLVGLRIKSGINRQVKELIGGTKGCVHIVELLQEIFKAAIQGNIRLIVDNMVGNERTAKLEEMLKGSCLRYTQEYSLMDLQAAMVAHKY